MSASDSVDYDVEQVPVETLRIGDVLLLDSDAGQLTVMIDHIKPYVRQDESGQDVSVFELIFGVVEGAKFAAWHPVAGMLANRIVPQREPSR